MKKVRIVRALGRTAIVGSLKRPRKITLERRRTRTRNLASSVP
jgi:hypothetical protein